MSCVLRINGIFFDVASFLNETRLIAYLQYKMGDEIGFKRRGKEKYETNGCSFELSIAELDNFEKQKADTISFLTTNFDKLKKVRSFGLEPEDIPVIDFAIESDSATYPVQNDYLPPELLKLTGDLSFGIKISHYDKSYFNESQKKKGKMKAGA
jgi:hypothetical protein